MTVHAPQSSRLYSITDMVIVTNIQQVASHLLLEQCASFFLPQHSVPQTASCLLSGILALVKEIYTALGMLHLVVGLLFLGYTIATHFLWDGHAPFNLMNSWVL